MLNYKITLVWLSHNGERRRKYNLPKNIILHGQKMVNLTMSFVHTLCFLLNKLRVFWSLQLAMEFKEMYCCHSNNFLSRKKPSNEQAEP